MLKSWLVRWNLLNPRRKRDSARRFSPWLEALEERCVPADYLVSNLNNAGAGSLRQAFEDLHDLGGAQNNINFQAALTGTISLDSILPELDKNVRVNGLLNPGGTPLVTVQRNPAMGIPQFGRTCPF